MRTPFHVVEIAVDRCPLTYGVGECKARLGVSGDAPCYNTWKTCQSPDAYRQEPESWFFCTPVSDLPKDQNFLPFLDGTPSHSNGSIDPGKSLGVRSQVSVSLRDAPHHDLTFDRYAHERAQPAQGTFFGRLRARWPYYYGRTLRWYSGFLGQSLSEMDCRAYVIEQMQWDGDRVSIVAKDPLKLADNDRAKAPRPSQGALAADLDEHANPATLDILTPAPAEYDWTRVVEIGSEVIQYTSTTPISGGVRLTGVSRTAPEPYVTERKSHKAGDAVQACLLFRDARPIDVVRGLLRDYAEVPAGYIPFAEWEQEYLTWLPGLTVTRLITKPEGVRQLLDELIPQTLSTFWWDERAQHVRYRAVRPLEPEATPPQLTDTSQIIANTLRVADEPDEQYNEIHVWYGQLNPTAGKDASENYRRVAVFGDLDSQSPRADGRRRILTLHANWHPVSNGGRVTQIGRRVLDTRVEVPRVVTLQLDAKDSGLWTGDVADLTTIYLQGDDGSPQTLRAQVVQVRERGDARFEYRLREDFFRGRYFRLAPKRLAGVSYRDGSRADQQRYGALSTNDGLLSDGSEGHQLL